MGIGLGIVLTLIGLTLVLHVVNVDLPYVDDYQLGLLLLIVGVVALLLVLTLNAMRGRSTQVVEHDIR